MTSPASTNFDDRESKDDDELAFASHRRPSRQQILNLLRPLQHEELMELLVSLIDEDPTLYIGVRDKIGSNEAFRKVFVHGLPPDTTEAELRTLFEKFGTPELVKVVMDRSVHPPKSKGYGFVVYPTIEEAHNALREPNKWFGGKEICCKLSMRSNPSEEQGLNGGLPPNVHNRKIFVSGLPFDLREEEFSEYFTSFGSIEHVQLVLDANGEGKGYGFVTYTHPTFARQAIFGANRKIWRGRPLIVAWCRKREDEVAGSTARKQSFSGPSGYPAPMAPNMHWQPYPSNQFPLQPPPQMVAGAAQPMQQWSGYQYVSPSQFIYIPLPMVQPSETFSLQPDEDNSLENIHPELG